MTPVEFHFDFGSPNAYFCHALIPQIEQRIGESFRYVPVLLGGVFKLTNNQPPMVAFAGVRNKMEYQRIEIARFVRRHRLDRFRFNPHFPVNTLLVMRAAIAAEQDGILTPYINAVFAALWEDGLKLDDPAIAAQALDAAGLDSARLLTRAQDPAIKDALATNTAASVARGTFGAPHLLRRRRNILRQGQFGRGRRSGAQVTRRHHPSCARTRSMKARNGARTWRRPG